MDIDSRGIRRGQCKAEGCDCDQFERPVSATYTACAYCGDPPTKHEKLPPLSKSEDDESRHGVSEGVYCLGSEETQNGSNSCRSNTNNTQTVNAYLKSRQIPDTGQLVNKDNGISSGQKLTDMEDFYQGTSQYTQVKRSTSVFSSATHYSDSSPAASITIQAQHTEGTHYKRDDPSKSASITRQAQHTEETHYKRDDPSKSASITRTAVHHTEEVHYQRDPPSKSAFITGTAQHTEETLYQREDLSVSASPAIKAMTAQHSEETLYQREDLSVSASPAIKAITAQHTEQSVLVSSSKQKIDGLNDGERSEIIAVSDNMVRQSVPDKSESSECKTLALASKETMRQISDCSESSDSESSGESSTDLSNTENELIPQSGKTELSGKKLQNIGQFKLETGNIHIHNNTEMTTTEAIRENIKSQSKSSLDIRKYEDQFYVETKAYEEVESVLSEYGHVTIYGKAGDGKTAMASHLMLQYAKGKGHDKKKYESLIVHSPEEFRNTVNTNRHQIALIDDVFGVANLDHDKLMRWMPVLKDLDKQHSINRERADENACRIKTLLIFTSRVHIANEAVNQADDFRFFRPVYVVSLSDLNFRLTHEEKRRILEGFAKRRNKEINDSTIEHIIALKEVHGFPHCVDLFTKHEYLFSQSHLFFSSPVMFLQREIEIIRKENKIQYGSLILAVLGNGAIRIDNLEELVPEVLQILGLPPHTSVSDILEGIQQLLGSYFLQTDNCFYFCHPSLLHAVAFVFGCHSKNIKVIIENCSFSFICERLRAQEYQPSSAEEVIKVHESQYCFLAQRLLSEFHEGNISVACSFQLLDDDTFLKAFLKLVSETNKPEIYFSLYKGKYCESEIDKFFPIFFWATFHGKSKFCGHVLREMNYRSTSIADFEQVLVNSFIAACRLGHIDLVRQIKIKLHTVNCQFKGSPSFSAFSLSTPLKNTVEDGHLATESFSTATYLFNSSTPIQKAVEGGHLDIIKFLVMNKADIFDTDVEQNSLLHRATYQNHIDVLRFLLEKQLDPNKVNDCFHTPLFYAKSKQAVESLVAHGADINFLDVYYQTPLFSCENIDTVKALIENGCDITIRSIQMRFAVSELASRGVIDQSTLALMVARGLDVNVRDIYGNTLLHHFAISRGENNKILPCLEYLLGIIDPNIVDDIGRTALHYAVCYNTQKNALARVQLFIKKSGIDINIIDTCICTKTALCKTQYINVAEELIEAGAFVSIPGVQNPYEIFASKGVFSTRLVQLGNNHFDLHQYLETLITQKLETFSNETVAEIISVIKEFNVHFKNVNLLLEKAVTNDSLQLVDVLMDKTYSLTHSNPLKNPYHLATSSRMVEKLLSYRELDVIAKRENYSLHDLVTKGIINTFIMEELKVRRVDFNGRNLKGETALFLVCEEKIQNAEVFNALVKAGTSVNAQNIDGCSILHKVASRGSISYHLFSRGVNRHVGGNNIFWTLCLDCLLQNGVDLLVSDKCGSLPIHVATEPLMALKLLEYGGEVSVYSQNQNGDHMVLVLAKNGALSLEVYLYLKKLGIDFNVRDEDGVTLLHYCVQCEHHPEDDVKLLHYLIEDISVNSVTNSGVSVLGYLLQSMLMDSDIKVRIELLLKQGYKINLSDFRHNSIFDFVSGEHLVLELLNIEGMHLIQTSVYCETPLLAIARRSAFSMNIFEKFKYFGSQIDAVNCNGENLLYLLLISNQRDAFVFETIKKLLENDLDFGMPSKIDDNAVRLFSSEWLIKRINCVTKFQMNNTASEQLRRIKNLILQNKWIGVNFNFENGKMAMPNNAIILNNALKETYLFESVEKADSILEKHSGDGDKIDIINKCLFMEVKERPNNRSFSSLSSDYRSLRNNSLYTNLFFNHNYLLKKGANINMSHEKGLTALHVAADADVQCFLIRSGADVNVVDDEGNTPLFTAKSPAVVTLMIRKGANVNHVNKIGSTALHVVNRLSVAKCLLANGADIDVKNNNGKKPIEGLFNSEIIYLPMRLDSKLEKGFQYNSLNRMARFDMLSLEVLKESLKTLKDFKHQNILQSDNLLHHVVTSRKGDSIVLPMVDFLLQNGMDPNLKDYGGDAPIHKLLLLDRTIPKTERLKLLLENKADIFIPGKEDKTPLDIVQDLPCAKLMVCYLLDSGITVSSLEILLIKFASNGLFVSDLVNQVKNKHGNIHACDKNGNTVLHYLILKADMQLQQHDIELFLKCLAHNGFDFRKCNTNQETALGLACLHNHPSLVELLLHSGSSLSHENVKRLQKQNLVRLRPIQLFYFGSSFSHDHDDAFRDPLLEGAPSPEVLQILVRNFPSIDGNQLISIGKNKFFTVDVFDALIERKTDLTLRNERQESLLHCDLNTLVLRKLIKTNCDVNLRDEYGRTPLHTQAYLSLHKVIDRIINMKLLLDAGADSSICDNKGVSIFEHVQNDRIAEFLIVYTESAVIDELGYTLHNKWRPYFDRFQNQATKTIAFLFQRNLQTARSVRSLHKKGADINIKDHDNRNLIQICLMSYVSERINIISYLLQQGLNINECDRNGKTALHLLLEMQDLSDKASTLQCLLEHGADWSLQDESGLLPTPTSFQAPFVLCMYAEYFDNASEQYFDEKPLVWYYAEKTKYLSLELLHSSIKHTVDISTTDTSGNTLLHIYFQNCSLVSALDVLRALKDKVDFGKQNIYGKTCLFYLSNKFDIYSRNIEPNKCEKEHLDTNLHMYWQTEEQQQTLPKYKGTEKQLKNLLSYLFENGVDINAVE